MYWLPPSRVKQSGNATTTGGMRCSPINLSSRSGRFSRKPTQFVCDSPLLVNPTRSTSSGNPCPSCPAGKIDIDNPHGWVSQHVVLKSLALDAEPADRTHRPEELAHASSAGCGSR